METPTLPEDGAATRSEVASNDLVRRLVQALDYVLNEDTSDELRVEFTFHGANWQEDEDDEYPPLLSDSVPLDIVEFSTNDELPGDWFEKRHLRELRELLTANGGAEAGRRGNQETERSDV